jgi:hypothetical protein
VPQVQLPQTAAAVPLPLPLHAAKALLRQNPFAPTSFPDNFPTINRAEGVALACNSLLSLPIVQFIIVDSHHESTMPVLSLNSLLSNCELPGTS